MSVDLDKLKERIHAHKHSEWRVAIEPTLSGPVIKDAYDNEILSIDVSHAVWTCNDEQDGCPEVSRDAIALARLLCDLPGYALELIQALKRLRAEVEGLERDLEEAERAF